VRAARAALDEAGMAAFADREYGTLSGGERQRVRVAQLRAQEARCMLLDEPLSHLDLHHQGRVLSLMQRLAGQGRAVAMVLHDALWAARACSHVLLLDCAGRASSGPASEVLTRAALESLYGCRLREFVDGGSRYLVPEIYMRPASGRAAWTPLNFRTEPMITKILGKVFSRRMFRGRQPSVIPSASTA